MLYKKYYAYGMSICLRYSEDKNEAAELLNDGFLKVFDNIKTFDSSKAFKPWFRVILIRGCIDRYRKIKPTEKILVDIEDIKLTQAYDKTLEIKDLLKLIRTIPEQYRTVFNLHDIEGYKHKEIAQMLDIKESSSRTFLMRAKRQLRFKYKQFYSSECITNLTEK
ncbi:MAG: RNA polymerase sigma factor [Bacteroidota bacterium]|nr:RNA polymerase sigma factor [Bacteroidota bacterium]